MFQSFIDKSTDEFRRRWQEQSFLQRLFGLAPDLQTNDGLIDGAAGSATFIYPDRSSRYEGVMFRGIELDLAVLDILVSALLCRHATDQPCAGIYNDRLRC